jgi:tetratricopeptide (TPR) repeat protein
MELNVARMTAGRHELGAALAAFRAAGDGRGEGRALDALAMALALSGDLDASIAHMRDALPLLADAGDRQTEVSCMANLAFALLYRGRRTEGEPWLGKALGAAHAIGARAYEAYVHSVSGELLEPFGDWGVALQEASAGLALARTLGHREWTVAALGSLGRLHRYCGDLVGARRFHDEMLAIARDLRTTLWIADAVGDVGQDGLAADEDEGARRLGEAIELAGDAVKFAMRPLLALADLALERRRPEEALDLARRVQQALAEYMIVATDGRRIEGEARWALGQVAEAEALLRRAKDEAVAAGALPAGWRASLALARLYDAAGRAPEGQAARADARRLLEKVGAGLTGAPALLRGFQESAPCREAGA